ncbi:unnamed protein product [Schistosoma curassoni]|uniref:Dopey_N domain-containing protein n=1 Tax=Schistosoma curassoni TaxID=6186 RepID=A0A183KR95_9TREM|nr:unnamed protein product [Schistosoma curassoni]
MGSSNSTLGNVSKDEPLQRFVGTDGIPPNSEYWREFLSSVGSTTKSRIEDTVLIAQNGLLILRLSVKYLMEHCSEARFFSHFSVNSPEGIIIFSQTVFSLGPHCLSVIECLFPVLFRLITNLPIHASLAPALVYRLLSNFSENRPVPTLLHGFEQYSLIWRAASSIAGMSNLLYCIYISLVDYLFEVTC